MPKNINNKKQTLKPKLNFFRNRSSDSHPIFGMNMSVKPSTFIAKLLTKPAEDGGGRCILPDVIEVELVDTLNDVLELLNLPL